MKSYKQKKKERREREIQVLYILPHIQPEWHTGDAPRRGECKGAHQDPLVCTCLYWGLPDI